MAERPASGFEFQEHPGDVKIRAWGADLEEVFITAARAMMAHLFGSDIDVLPPSRTETIEVEAPDREALLVAWLSELLYLATAEYQAYVGFQIVELNDTVLRAKVGAVSAEAVEDIKAVTHHELSIEERDGGWQATVVFDI